jgi:putative MATE family efflux protein
VHGDAPQPLLVRLQARLAPAVDETGEPVGSAPLDVADGRRLTRTIWAVSLPLLLVYLGDTVVHVVDTAFLGRVGTTELAALALVYTLFEVVMVPVIGLADGMQIVIARRVGQDRDDLAAATFLGGMLLILVVSVALAVGLHAGAPAIGDVLAGDRGVAAAAGDFLRIAAFGVVPGSLTLGYAALYVGLARTAVLVGATILLAGTNLVLSYGLTLGELGWPRLGMRGAAWAFVGAETVTFVFLTIFTMVVTWRQRGNPLRRRAAAAGPTIRPLLRLAPPLAMRGLLRGLQWLGFFLIIEQVSEEALARSNIIYACFAVFLIPSYAVGESTTSLVSNVIGQGRTSDVLTVTRRATLAAYLVTAPFAVLALVTPQTVIAIFTDDPAVIAGAAPSLRLLAVAMVLIIPAEVSLAAVTGTAAVNLAFAIELVLTVVMLAATYVAAVILGLSLALIWTSTGLGALVALAISAWWLATRAQHLEPSAAETPDGADAAMALTAGPLHPDDNDPYGRSSGSRATNPATGTFDHRPTRDATRSDTVSRGVALPGLDGAARPVVSGGGGNPEPSLAALVVQAMSRWWFERVKHVDSSGAGARRTAGPASTATVRPFHSDEDDPHRPSVASGAMSAATETLDHMNSDLTGTGTVYGRAAAPDSSLPSAAPSRNGRGVAADVRQTPAERTDDGHGVFERRHRRRPATLILLASAIVAVFGAAATGLSLLQPTVYGARADVVLIPRAELTDAAADRAMITQAMIIQGDAVLTPVAAATGIPLSRLRGEVSATIVGRSTILRLTVGDRNRDRAVLLAQLITTEYVRTAAASSAGTGSPAEAPPPVTPTVLSTGCALDTPLQPKLLRALAIGVLLGLIAAIGALIVLVRP